MSSYFIMKTLHFEVSILNFLSFYLFLFMLSSRLKYPNMISISSFSRTIPNFLSSINFSFLTRILSCIKKVSDFHKTRSSVTEITLSARAIVNASIIRSFLKTLYCFVETRRMSDIFEKCE